MSDYKYSKSDYRLNQKMYMYADVSDHRLVESYFFDRRLCISKLSSYVLNACDTSGLLALEGEFNFPEKFDFEVIRDESESLVRGLVDRFETDHLLFRHMITNRILDYDILEFIRCRFEISKILYRQYKYRKPVIDSLEIHVPTYSLVQICWLLLFKATGEYKFLSAALKLGDFISFRLQTSNEAFESDAFSLLSAFECEYKIMCQLFSNRIGKVTL